MITDIEIKLGIILWS